MPIGPQLPPHLAKRKRDDDEDERSASSASSSSDEDAGPKPPASEDASKKRRIMGPAAPPAPLDERQAVDPSGDDSSSDDSDDYGPALPGATTGAHPQKSVFDDPKHAPVEEETMSKRDDWMMMPPTQDGLAARMDPTKLKARGFNTGKSARGGKTDGGTGVWFETPDEKRKRLQNEVMGIKTAAPATEPDDYKARAKKAQDEETARKIQKHNDEHRSQSLYAQHKGSAPRQAADDDPAKRAFDYEKDMSAAPKVSHAQKRELLSKASDFGSRFSKGSFL